MKATSVKKGHLSEIILLGAKSKMCGKCKKKKKLFCNSALYQNLWNINIVALSSDIIITFIKKKKQCSSFHYLLTLLYNLSKAAFVQAQS